MTVNKKEFTGRLAKIGGIKKNKAKEYVDLFIDTLIDCLGKDDTVKICGFGTFTLKTIPQKPARNPKTGEKCIMPEHKKVKFYPTEGLAKRIETGLIKNSKGENIHVR